MPVIEEEARPKSSMVWARMLVEFGDMLRRVAEVFFKSFCLDFVGFWLRLPALLSMTSYMALNMT